MHAALATSAANSSTSLELNHKQKAELARYDKGDFDVALGMLERRIDGVTAAASKVRDTLVRLLRTARTMSGKHKPPRPAPIHRALMRLADRGGAITIATTNFDRLLEAAAKGHGKTIVQSHALGAIPRPGRTNTFAGVLHIHGALSADPRIPSDIIVTDQDFGEFYLRRRIVPDFIYDAARLFHLVLVGYSLSDAPMRYLLNAVAADGSRFDDLKERFAFVGADTFPDPVLMEDWKGRGITPIPYDSSAGHSALSGTLTRWADFSAINGDPNKVNAALKRIVRKPRTMATDADRDLFDHLVRRSNTAERLRITGLISKSGAKADWLNSIANISQEPDKDQK